MKFTSSHTNGMIRMIFILGLMTASFHAQSQDKFNISLKAGIAVPTHELSNTKLNAGIGYEGTMGYQLTQLVGVYAGWSHTFFTTDEKFAGLDLDFEETGYTTGIQFTYPAELDEVRYTMGVGILYNHLEAEAADGEIVADSGHELGAQIEGMIAIPLSQTLSIIPFARYRTVDMNININEATIPTTLKYIGIGTGIKWTF